MEIEILVREDEFFKFVTDEDQESIGETVALIAPPEEIVVDKYEPILENFKSHPWFD
jgi:hypothetical protein